MGLTLHGSARTRASIPLWYLEEKGIDYRWAPLDLAAGEHHQPAYLAVNPFAKVPALVDDGLRGPDGGPLQLFESGAILLHLAEHHGDEFTGEADRAAALRSLTAQWILFANSTLGPALVMAQAREKVLPGLLSVLNGKLQEGRSLLAGRWGDPLWGAADCAVQAYLAYLPLFLPDFDLSPYPQVEATVAATRQRASYQRAMERR